MAPQGTYVYYFKSSTLPSGAAGPIAVLLLCTIFFFLTSSSRKLPKGLRRVPGPRGYPIIGNIPQLSDRPQQQLKAWARTYGELFQLRLGLNNWIYLNSPQATREILDKQSHLTSSRIPAPVASDIIGGDMRFVLMPDTQRWKDLRGPVHKMLTPSKSKLYMPSQDLEAKQFTYDLLVDNKNETEFYTHTRRFATSIIMAATYGWRLPESNGAGIQEIYDILHELSESMVPGTWIADTAPFLARLPKCLQWWRKEALEHFNYQTKVWMRYWKQMEMEIEEGTLPDCFGKHLLDKTKRGKGLTELENVFLAGSMVEAGAETTSTTLNSCFRYLAVNPDVQARAHAEIDVVIGRSRMPDFLDQPNLPYIEACFRETSRLRPPSNNGVLHYTTANLSYKGFHIPRGTMVVMNQYAMYYDPTRYEDPERFLPDRFLDKVENENDENYLPDRWVFGAGRRLCPGMHFAVNSMYIALARVLWAFEIRPPLDECGKEIELDVGDYAYKDGRFTVPKPCRLRFLPRGPDVEDIVCREWRLAGEGLEGGL